MEIHLLDMGTEKYGDCILITNGERKILIDGAHKGDTTSISFQLSKLLRQQPPFKFDLLIVTHCHADHIGCLPQLLNLGEIETKVALLADPLFRWKNGFSGSDSKYPDAQQVLSEAYDEEDRSDMDDANLEQFLFDAVSLGPGYQKMIDNLKKTDCDVYLYQGIEEDYSDLEEKFSDFGLKILGPTKEHLNITQDSLNRGTSHDAVSDMLKSVDSTSQMSMADAYRNLMSKQATDSEEAGIDFMNKGAVNSQSIVIKLKSENWSALLAGDMQFADAQVTGLYDEMAALLKKVNDEGPYDFIKTSHHTSYNGLNEEMLDYWISQNTILFAHTGGSIDASHPEKNLLDILKKKKDKIIFARNDRNGIVSVSKDGDGQLKMWLSKGDFNNFERNKGAGDTNITTSSVANEPKNIPAISNERTSPVMEQQSNEEFVKVTVKIPHTTTTVRLTIEVEPQKKKLIYDSFSKGLPQIPQEESDRFNNLIFITCSKKLKLNIGEAETQKIIEYLQRINGAIFVDIPLLNDAMEAKELIRNKFTPTTKGIVIIGGYDVVPSLQLDVLEASLRKSLQDSGEEGNDHDGFIVWNDDIYADMDDDTFAEFPVSRIPDGKSAELVFNALTAKKYKIKSKFGIRNLVRPFAIDIFDMIPSIDNTSIGVSEDFSPFHIQKDEALGAVYYMLHGSDNDATRYWGERKKGGYFEAIEINNIPSNASETVIFSGCCWGALTVQPAAYKKIPSIPLRPLTPEQSIAMAYLKAGALAFVGCTGTHYSPLAPPYNFFGKPMHDAFWRAISRGEQPAKALFEAKKEYGSGLPHGLEKDFSKAIELKILRQFTCLGLGW